MFSSSILKTCTFSLTLPRLLQKTARDCIAHLKAGRLAPMTFLPLDTIKTRPVSERLRSLGGTAKLALDLLHADSHLQPALLFVCGWVLMCALSQCGSRGVYGHEEMSCLPSHQ